MSTFEGKVALVTGGASGIGRATALQFAEAGARVVVADLNENGGNEVVETIRSGGGEAIFARTDVTSEADVAGLVQAAVTHYGGLHCAVNNAGMEGRPGVSTVDLAESDWTRILSVNLTSVWLCMRAELRHMLAHGGGTIVNMSSTAGVAAAVNSGVAYAASKHGVIGLTKTAAKEYANRNIRINAVCPGGVATPLLERTIGTEAFANAKDRLATPEEIAASVLWLSSGASPFVTGHALIVDGGRLA